MMIQAKFLSDMTLEQRITDDLRAGQATLENICANVKASQTAVSATLRRMEKQGKVWTMENKDGDTVYKLTYEYKQPTTK
jgi:DNA-binding transcriptional regulator PaaX